MLTMQLPRPRVRQPWRSLAHVRRPFMSPVDRLALEHAHALQRRSDAVRCSGITGQYSEIIFQNTGNFTAVNTTASEASLLGGNLQPVLPAGLFNIGGLGYGKALSIRAKGILGTTSTPTIIFQARLGTTAGSSFLSGPSVGVSAAITTVSGVSNKWWGLDLDLTCSVPGIGTGNTTLFGSGEVRSPGGFASPFIYPLEPTTPDTATWTSTIDAALTQYLNLSVTWDASSASNTITLKELRVILWN